jgi:hypothetical protein
VVNAKTFVIPVCTGSRRYSAVIQRFSCDLLALIFSSLVLLYLYGNKLLPVLLVHLVFKMSEMCPTKVSSFEPTLNSIPLGLHEPNFRLRWHKTVIPVRYEYGYPHIYLKLAIIV